MPSLAQGRSCCMLTLPSHLPLISSPSVYLCGLHAPLALATGGRRDGQPPVHQAVPRRAPGRPPPHLHGLRPGLHQGQGSSEPFLLLFVLASRPLCGLSAIRPLLLFLAPAEAAGAHARLQRTAQQACRVLSCRCCCPVLRAAPCMLSCGAAASAVLAPAALSAPSRTRLPSHLPCCRAPARSTSSSSAKQWSCWLQRRAWARVRTATAARACVAGWCGGRGRGLELLWLLPELFCVLQ